MGSSTFHPWAAVLPHDLTIGSLRPWRTTPGEKRHLGHDQRVTVPGAKSGDCQWTGARAGTGHARTSRVCLSGVPRDDIVRVHEGALTWRYHLDLG